MRLGEPVRQFHRPFTAVHMRDALRSVEDALSDKLDPEKRLVHWERCNAMAGGCIWDWVDQMVRKQTAGPGYERWADALVPYLKAK